MDAIKNTWFTLPPLQKIPILPDIAVRYVAGPDGIGFGNFVEAGEEK
jgi:hypothetical protein